MNYWYQVSISLFFFSLSLSGLAQAQRDKLNPEIGNTRNDSIPEGIMPLDTSVPMSYVLIADPGQPVMFQDSFEWKDVNHTPHNFTRAHLGNLGSVSRSLAPGIDSPIGFSPGWFQYDPSYLHEATFRYYGQHVPVSKIKYSQAGREDTYLTLDFGRSFADGLNLSFQYLRSNQIGEFAHQRQKNTGFGIGVWHHAPSGRYDAFYNYIANAAIAEENGGVTAPELIGDPLYPDETIPVNVTGGITTHKHRSFLTKQIVHLTSDTSQFGIDLWLQAQFITEFFKYADEEASLIPDYYGSKYLVDQRGIRQYTFDNENQWSFGVALPWKAANSSLQSSLRYRSISLEQEPVLKKINELYLDLSGDFHWIEAFSLKGKMSLGLGQAEGAFSFRADGDINTGLLGHLLGHWSIMSRRPYMVESALYVNQQQVYDSNLQNPLINDVGISWEIPKQKFKVGASWLLFDQYIYFDTVSFPQQINASFSLQRFFIDKEFDFKWIGVKGYVIWQPNPRIELAIPDLLYTASLYGRIRVADQKVTFIPGVDVNYHGGYSDISYFPVTGKYHLTDGQAIPDYLRIDVGLGLHINFIKAFARMEDVVGLFQERVLYQADYYPHYRGYFRFGFEASFFN